MGGEIIKSFLVGLGFDVDDESFKKFNKAILSATAKVTALYASIKVASAGIFLGISKISEGFEQIGYEFRIIAPMINKTLVLRQELLRAYKAANVNIYQAIQNSVKFNMSLARTKIALKAIYDSVGAKFFPMLTKQMDIFRSKIYANMPKIQESLEKFIKFIFKAFEATVTLGARVYSILGRVWDFFKKLHDATQGWSSIILGMVAAWKLFNLSFLATPLGMILTGLLAILALYDDFMTWKEGGQSFFDWGSETTKTIVGLATAILGVVAAIYATSAAITVVKAAYAGFTATMAIFSGLMKALRLTWLGLNLVMYLNPIGLWIAGVTALIALIGVLIYKWDAIKEGIGNFFSGLGGNVLNMIGGGGMPQTAPLGSNTSNNTSNKQTVDQQTSIYVQGSSDANSVGKAVASEQGKVNFDLVRNLRGAMR